MLPDLPGQSTNIAPVVFSCNLGTPLVSHEFENMLGSMTYMISQTPQVWLDFQVYETGDELLTSGSTGEPKGVEVSHAGAFNTIHTVSSRYGISSQDILLGASSIEFDLSVYDIFGWGGTLVTICDEDRRNAGQWLQLVEKHNVTIWNSVPILLEMLLVTAKSKDKTVPKLRLAVLCRYP